MISDIAYRIPRFGFVSVYGFYFLRLQLLFSRFVSFRASFIAITIIIVFFRLPTPAYIYIFRSRLISNRSLYIS